MTVSIATKRLLDSVWTIVYTITDDNKAVLHRYTRDERLGYKLEKECPEGYLEEDSDRNVMGLVIDDVTYPVINSKYVFSYN